MANQISTTVSSIPDSRVRIEVEVSADEVKQQAAIAAKSLAKKLRVPGFRKGKVPPALVIRQLGWPTVLDQAIRDSLDSWYPAAIEDANIQPATQPEIDFGDLPDEGQPFRFSIQAAVLPQAKLGKYKKLEVGREEVEVQDELIDTEIERLRERMGKLEDSSEPATEGNYVLIDYTGTVDGEEFVGGQARDQLIELGSGQLVPGFEHQLLGANPGEEREVNVHFPDDYRAEDLAGKDATFTVTVKQVKTKQLPDIDDEFAQDVGFDDISELRTDIASRLKEAHEHESEDNFREAVLDAVVENATVTIPEAMVKDRARETFAQAVRALAQRGITKQSYLQITGKTEDELISEAQPDARQALEREAVIKAVIAAEKIVITDEKVLERIKDEGSTQQDTAQQDAEALLEKIRAAHRLNRLKSDMAEREALDFLVENAKPIAAAKAKAREKIWTPGKKDRDKDDKGAIWTPGG